jgi:cytochrome c-type biogenesis protein CcmH
MSENLRRILAGVVTVALAAVVVVGLVVGEDTERDRIEALGKRIKCPVCQGEPIADSPSETSRAMMDIVAERVEAGETDDQIVDYFVSRYGDGILLDPPFEGRTLALWLLPGVALIAGIVLIIGRRRTPDSSDSEVSS